MVVENAQHSLCEPIQTLWRQMKQRHHRMCVLIEGDQREELALRLFGHEGWLVEELPVGEVVTLSDENKYSFLGSLWPGRDHHTLSWAHARARLGGSEAALIIDLSEGCDPDALGASLSVVKGGGLILFLSPCTPPKRGRLNHKLAVWPNDASSVTHHLWSRLWTSLRSPQVLTQLSNQVWVSTDQRSEENRSVTLPKPIPKNGQRSSNHEMRRPLSALLEQILAQVTLNDEQKIAIRIMINSHQREAFTAVSITAHRGRGKSSVMGIAAACYLLMGEREVIITAPSEYACEAIFVRARETLEYAGASLYQLGQLKVSPVNEIRSSKGVIRFISPRELWRETIRPPLILVDEAASFPVPFLERLLKHKPSVVFATTTHGYEGSGRGFSLRFRPTLQKRVRKLYEPILTHPLRWAQDDPIERWSSEALLLETQLPQKVVYTGLNTEWEYERHTSSMIARDPLRYEQVFTLLVNAHYRTQPSDLWRLLDAPNLSIHLLVKSHSSALGRDSHLPTLQVLAAAIVSNEGELTSALAAELYEGRQRPRGQLFAANLAVHLNYEIGATLKLARIIRIATLPMIQCRGLGDQLLKEIKKDVQRCGIDLLGSSFGATHQLMRFWLRADFIPLRVSVRQSHVSGERSLLVVHPLSADGQKLTQDMYSELFFDLEDQLRGSASDISPELAFILLCALAIREDSEQERSSCAFDGLELSNQQWRSLGAVAFSGRAFELAARPARQLALHWIKAQKSHLLSRSPLTPLGRLLIMKVIQGRGWLEVTSRLDLGSTSETMKGLSASLRLLYFHMAPAWALEWVKRFPQYDMPAKLSHALMPIKLKNDING